MLANVGSVHLGVYRLLVSCPDHQGLVAEVSQLVAKYKGNIIEAHHHLDIQNNRFFMRNEIETSGLSCSLEEYEGHFADLAAKYDMAWSFSNAAEKKRILLLGSQSSHCVADLLHRWHEDELEGEIVGIISNHQKLSKLAGWYDVPFEHVPINKDQKDQDFQTLAETVEKYQPDVIVLARYMQILPPAICQAYPGKIINIHHSFLPSFIGANPYKKAEERGVKLIGATCHIVTEDLDAGAIIEQDVIRVNHTHDAKKMRQLGKDVERVTLAKGLQYYLEDRVLICNNKTIVFS